MTSPEQGMVRYRIKVGHVHEVKPGNIVGAIANEAGMESKHIGAIKIFDDFSLVDLPEGMPKEVEQTLKNTRVCGQKLLLSKARFDKKGDQDASEKNGRKGKQKLKMKDKPGEHSERKKPKSGSKPKTKSKGKRKDKKTKKTAQA